MCVCVCVCVFGGRSLVIGRSSQFLQMSKLHRSSFNSVRKKPDIAIRASKAIGQRRRNRQKVTTMRISLCSKHEGRPTAETKYAIIQYNNTAFIAASCGMYTSVLSCFRNVCSSSFRLSRLNDNNGRSKITSTKH